MIATMIRVTGTIPASEPLPEDSGAPKMFEVIDSDNEQGWTIGIKPPHSRDAESFDLSYTQAEGWTNPDAFILLKIYRKMQGVKKIRLLPYRGGYTPIKPTLDGTEAAVASTVATFGAQLHPPLEDFNVVSDSPPVDEPGHLY
jgi:hypothetical protein